MRQVIWKYALNDSPGTILSLPGDFEILHVQRIKDTAYLWIRHSPVEDRDELVNDLTAHQINVYDRGTGWTWDEDDFQEHYIGSVADDDFYMWHYYYEFVN